MPNFVLNFKATRPNHTTLLAFIEKTKTFEMSKNNLRTEIFD